MQFNGVWNLRSTSFTRAVSVCYICMGARISRALNLVHRALQRFSWHFSQRFLNVSVFLNVGTPWRLSPLPCPSLSFHCFISVMGACFFSFHVGAHGWVAWICQPWEWSPSRSWLPIVEIPGCLRKPTSTLRGMQLLNEHILLRRRW